MYTSIHVDVVRCSSPKCRAVGAGPAINWSNIGPAAARPIFDQLTRAKMPYELWWVVQLLL